MLTLANCRVASTSGLVHLRRLERLDLAKNDIADLADLYALLGALTNLRDLDLSHNPVTTVPKYREKAIVFSSARLGTFCPRGPHDKP